MNIPITKVMVYESKNTKITFEPDLDNPHPDSNYIRAMEKLNSRFIATGLFPKYVFDRKNCRAANEIEIKWYLRLKNGSREGINRHE